MKATKTYPEYTKLQKDRIVNSFLEHYKDGKYAFKEEKKKQSQGYYNSKSEILKGLESWCEEDIFVKYLIPILDYNLETDQQALEDEWVKNHQLQIKCAEYKSEAASLNKNMDHMANVKAQELMKEWVSDKEDVMNLQNALDESEQKRIAGVRKHHMKVCGLSNKLDNSEKAFAILEKQLRDLRDKCVEEEFNHINTGDERAKLNDQLDKLKIKSEKSEIQNEKLKMETELLKMKLKNTADESKALIKSLKHELRTEKEQVKLWKAISKSPRADLDLELAGGASPPGSP